MWGSTSTVVVWLLTRAAKSNVTDNVVRDDALQGIGE